MYACDAAWWDASGPDRTMFNGERWSSHAMAPRKNDDKREAAEKHQLRLVPGRDGNGFCFDGEAIHYGGNSGFQAINLALKFGAKRVALIGYDMHKPNGKAHFFGEHPPACRKNSDYRHFIGAFEAAARMLPPDIEIVNCTPGSALQCFPRVEL